MQHFGNDQPICQSRLRRHPEVYMSVLMSKNIQKILTVNKIKDDFHEADASQDYVTSVSLGPYGASPSNCNWGSPDLDRNNSKTGDDDDDNDLANMAVCQSLQTA